MKKLLVLGLGVLLIGLTNSCRKLIIEKPIDNTPTTNFEYLWEQIRDKYSFMDYKNLDWQAIHDKYKPLIHDDMTQYQLFDVLEDMTNELRDGHANVFSPYRTSNYLPVITGSPVNYDGDLIFRSYILRDPKNYFEIGPFLITKWDTLGAKIGYLRYRSFQQMVSENDMETVLQYFKDTDGVILDVRSNGGGSPVNVFTIAQHFCTQPTLVYYSALKNGPDKNDFLPAEEVWIEPVGTIYTKPVAILTNRECFSATSFFSVSMRNMPQVRLVGDSTGGGLGAPNGGQLPNGWSYRFSVTQTLSAEKDVNGNHYNWEDGVPAHILIDMDPADKANGFDSILERGIQYVITGI